MEIKQHGLMKVDGFSYHPVAMFGGRCWRWAIRGNVVTRGPRSSLWEFDTPEAAFEDLREYLAWVSELYRMGE